MEALAMLFLFFAFMGIPFVILHERAGRRKRVAAANTFEKPNICGTAHFSTDEDCARGRMFSGKGIRLAFSKASGKLLYYAGKSHLLCVAPTGAGKARDLLIPAILDLGKKSLLAVDPKGQLLAVCHAARLKCGPVFSLSPFGILRDYAKGVTFIRYNSMASLNPDSPTLAIRSDKIAEGLVWTTGSGSVATDNFFDEGAKELLSGLMMALVCHCKPERRNLPAMCDVLCGDVFGFCQEIVGKTSNRFIRQRLAPFAEKGAEDNKTLQAIVATARVNTKFIRNEVIGESLSASDFSFRQLRERVCSLFLVLPLSALDVCDRYFRLIVASALAELLTEENLGKTPLLCVLDEAAQLGRLSILEKAVAMARGFGVQFWTIFTDLPQMEQIYGHGFRTFMANSGCRMFMAPNDSVTATELSTLSGQAEVVSHSRSVTLDNLGEPHVTDSSTQHARPLLLPHEVRELGDDVLIFCEGVNGVIRAERRPYYKTHRGTFRPDPYEKGNRRGLLDAIFGE